MNFNGVNFNEKFWADKPVKDFIKHESHHGLSEDQLKEAHALMVPPKATKPAEKP